MWKKKILIQICICMIISGGYMALSNSQNKEISEKCQSAVAAMSKHYTVSDIWNKSRAAAAAVVKSPAVVTNYVINSQEMQKYGEPVDKTETGETTSVYAVSGGQVIETGENDQIGIYVKIRHENSTSTYGNCKKLYVKEGEHVRRGQVIASFYKADGVEFYYDLKEIES